MKKSPSKSSTTQRDAFIRTARDLGCDEDQEAFERAVRKLVKAPRAPRTRRKKDAQDKSA
jgi:hypothetical protein